VDYFFDSSQFAPFCFVNINVNGKIAVCTPLPIFVLELQFGTLAQEGVPEIQAQARDSPIFKNYS
jgi:hypothetical protein